MRFKALEGIAMSLCVSGEFTKAGGADRLCIGLEEISQIITVLLRDGIEPERSRGKFNRSDRRNQTIR